MHRGQQRPAAWDTGESRHSSRRGRIGPFACAVLIAGLVLAGTQGSAGHQVGHYPSYYPDEIRIDVMDPATAGKALGAETVHAYVGGPPSFPGPVPGHVKRVTSLGAFVVLSLEGASARFPSSEARCAAARSILADLRSKNTDRLVFHPYPVTPYHADYLHHVDRIEAVMGALENAVRPAQPVKVAGRDPLERAIVEAKWCASADAGEFVLRSMPVEELIAAAGGQIDGWSGPPWIREGWFHAYQLLAGGLDAAQREAVDQDYEALTHGEARSFAEHVDTERRLVAALTDPCRRLVVGYVPREEYFDDRYPEGIENVGYDSLSGLNAPVFVRTAKLKDYPWNGKLHLAVEEGSYVGWNPVAGFEDRMGRLVWSAVGDPAVIAYPANASWMPNRFQSEVTRVKGQSGGIRVPGDAVRPQLGSGVLESVGDRAFAAAKIVYQVLASPFEDGTETTTADLIYPFAFAYRWGDASRGDRHDQRLAAALAVLVDRLVGFKHLRTETTTNVIAEGMNLVVRTPVLEVYVRDAPGDEQQLAALAPPWSTVPWHLLALMEEAVARGYAAFSREEAARRGVPWLDLVHDGALKAKLLDLVAAFERESYRPEPLKEFVTPEEAQARWRALRGFAERSGHFLVANGPYRLKAWTNGSVVLEAVREMSYPLGFGTFDRFVNPPRATIENASREGGEITVSAGAEMILKAGRGYRLDKEPLLHTTSRGVYGLLVASRYLLIAPDGKVLAADKMHWAEDGRFRITLPDGLAPGSYTVVLGIFLDGNAVQPSAKILRFEVAGNGAPG